MMECKKLSYRCLTNLTIKSIKTGSNQANSIKEKNPSLQENFISSTINIYIINRKEINRKEK